MTKSTAIAIGVIAALFFLLIWPTPYQIYKHPRGEAYRVNRFTGVVEVATPSGWRRRNPM